MLNSNFKARWLSQTLGFRMTTFLKSVLLLCLSAAIVPVAFCQNKSLSIEGKVRTGDGKPIPSDVTVRLEEAEGVVVNKQFVGINGKFEFDNLTGDLYRLVVTAEGFQTVQRDVDMHYLASRYPNIYLIPSDLKETPGSSSPTVNATDLAATKKARKEFEKGHVALQKGKYEEARGHLEKAVAEDPCFARAQASLGVALSMQQLLAPAEAALRKSISCDSGFLEAYIQLAILLNIENKFAENEANLLDNVRHFPTEWQLYYQLGIAERGAGELDQAQESYLKAQSINPAVPPEFHVKLADVYLRSKEYEKAYAEMQAYLCADPNGRYAEETRALMKRVETSGLMPSVQKRGDPSLR